MKVWLDQPAGTNTPAVGPKESVTDITFRRLQKFKVSAGQTCSWKSVCDGKTVASGTIQQDECGLLTIRKTTVTTVSAEIRLAIDNAAKKP
jgi:hypothetical protein